MIMCAILISFQIYGWLSCFKTYLKYQWPILWMKEKSCPFLGHSCSTVYWDPYCILWVIYGKIPMGVQTSPLSAFVITSKVKKSKQGIRETLRRTVLRQSWLASTQNFKVASSFYDAHQNAINHEQKSMKEMKGTHYVNKSWIIPTKYTLAPSRGQWLFKPAWARVASQKLKTGLRSILQNFEMP